MFRVNTQQMTWSAAKRFCENDGARLASIRNEWAKSYSHMASLNLKAPLWIGLNRKAVWHRKLRVTVKHNCEYTINPQPNIGEVAFAKFAFRLVDISDLLMDSVSPQPSGHHLSRKGIIIVCMFQRRGDGRLVTVIRRWPAFV